MTYIRFCAALAFCASFAYGQNIDATRLRYTAPNGGIQRTIFSRLGDVVSVKDFGAKGDGITDDSAAFNAAAVQATAGKQIDVPGGAVYLLSRTVTLTNFEQLDCHGSTLTSGAANMTMLAIAGQDISVRNCHFEQNSKTGVRAISIISDTGNRIFDSFENLSFYGSGDQTLNPIYIYSPNTAYGNYYHSFHNIEINFISSGTGIILDAFDTIHQVNRSTFDQITFRNCATPILRNRANTTNLDNISVEGCATGITIANNPGNGGTFISGYRAEAITSNTAIDIQGSNVTNTQIVESDVDSPYMINDLGVNTQIISPVYTNTLHPVGLNVFDDSFNQTPNTKTNGVTLAQIVAGQNQGSNDLLHVCPWSSNSTTSLACGSPFFALNNQGKISTAVTLTNPAATNDATVLRFQVNVGTDATLGPLSYGIYLHPSATGANRYVALAAGDSLALRPLVLNGNGFGVFGNVLVGTTTDNGARFQVNGVVNSTSGGFKFPDGTTQSSAGIQPSAIIISTNTTVSSSGSKNQTLIASGNITVTLYAASAVPGGIITVKKTDTASNTITINTAGGNIDGQASVLLQRQYDSYTMISDGTNWNLI
jgi:hypothetical protein